MNDEAWPDHRKHGELQDTLPCRICGDGRVEFNEHAYWTGMRSQTLDVTLMHWCKGLSEDEFVRPSLSIRCRDRAQAVEIWNRCFGAPQ